jgi:hypothetical protein
MSTSEFGKDKPIAFDPNKTVSTVGYILWINVLTL